jgi:hypothetical protein
MSDKVNRALPSTTSCALITVHEACEAGRKVVTTCSAF